MYYIQESDKPSCILNFFNIIKLDDNKIILPISDEEVSDKKAEKLAIRTKAILDETSCKKIVISKKIKRNQNYINKLHTYQYEISDGKWLFKALTDKVLDYIVEKKKLIKQETRNSDISK